MQYSEFKFFETTLENVTIKPLASFNQPWTFFKQFITTTTSATVGYPDLQAQISNIHYSK